MNKPVDKIFLKPAHADVNVRNPDRGGHLADEGEWVTRNVYWFRRVRDGDAVETKPSKKTATKSDKE